MEGFLTVIIILLILSYILLNSKLDTLEFEIKKLKETLLKAASENKLNTQPLEKTAEAPKPIVDKQAVIEKPRVIENAQEPEKPKVIFEIKNQEQLIEKKPNPIVEKAKPQKTWWEGFREKNPDLEKFVGENLISKIGILILVLGISYFVKFAIDKDWINETARVGIGFLAGGILIGLAHKLRINFKAFSSVLVAGAIAVFYFTLAIAFHQYHLFSQTTAFALMTIITAFSVLISVSYNRMELAILSLIGGFAVPFMLSTGQGNYQVLFTYISILDVGILAIAYWKRWSLVTLLAFVFTVFLFGGWIITAVNGRKEAPYLGAIIFATIFYFIFIVANIINHLRTSGIFKQIELIGLAITSFLYFWVAMIVFSTYHPELKGAFTILLALSNLISAWILVKKYGLDKNAVYLFVGLTLTFVTMAIPLQFSDGFITIFWAGEAALLMWLSQKSKIVLFRLTSVFVHVLMLLSLILNVYLFYVLKTVFQTSLLNEVFIEGAFASASLFFTFFLIKNETEKENFYGLTINLVKYREIVRYVSIIVLYLTFFSEIKYQADLYLIGGYSPTSIVILYHMLFTSVIIFLFRRTQNKTHKKLAVEIALFNILLYIVYFSSIAFGELRENLILISTHKIAFILHYLSLGLIVFQGISVMKDGVSNNSLNVYQKNWFIWIGAFAIVYVASNEILIHGLSVMTDNIQEGEKIYSVFRRYNADQTFLIKVVFPILWGFLAILFLTLGIKKQMRSVRIVSLSLLGLTIIKLFVYDISNASETGKIIAFILLGIIILVMSFAYQKIKQIVMEDEKPTENQSDENQ